MARAADYGVVIEGRARMDMKTVKARKDAVSDNASNGLETWLKAMPNCTVVRGEGRFIEPPGPTHSAPGKSVGELDLGDDPYIDERVGDQEVRR